MNCKIATLHIISNLNSHNFKFETHLFCTSQAKEK